MIRCFGGSRRFGVRAERVHVAAVAVVAAEDLEREKLRRRQLLVLVTVRRRRGTRTTADRRWTVALGQVLKVLIQNLACVSGAQ